MGQNNKVTFYEKRAVSVSSQMNGANLNTLGFNMDSIGKKDPILALKIYELFQEAKQLNEDSPMHPEEDFALTGERLNDFAKVYPDLKTK